jgi:hypothetical protein
MLDQIKELIEGRNALGQTAYDLYNPIVAEYISINCQDSNKIEYTLDYMLELCFDAQMLLLYRKLCAHLYSFNPDAALFYVNEYVERWDEDKTQFGKGVGLNQ